ncbi:hypothetical protein [Phyllobacterium sp. YR531]|uniref:hypothetical protein n=1 Tax=Phyllobacterium sp. YR531 TaxID=1144343 RepID=UPI00026F5B5E|nr:hypothetical protein [Phyllobacterium sp. YR531]EJN04482.1 hypothetical protein PMI41_02123 [Phyllobacterium sp. YR531]
MTNLPKGLYPLPAGQDVSIFFSEDTKLTKSEQRERAFFIINEFIAQQDAGDNDSAALEKLASLLGTSNPKGSTTRHPAEREAARIDARWNTRRACRAAIEAGYRP